MVYTVRFLKTEWFKNNTENGGAMNETIEKAQDSHVILHSQTKKHGRMWGSLPADDLINIINKNYGLYEVLAKFPRKMYFDIDKDRESVEDTAEFLETVKAQILAVFVGAKMAVSGSISEKKISYHVVLNNYIIEDENQLKTAKILVQALNQKNEGFDWKVYTKNRNMKIINQSKLDGRVQEIIEDERPENHIISAFFQNETLIFPSISEETSMELKIKKSLKNFDIGILPKMILEEPADFDDSTPEKVLSYLPINEKFPHDYTHLIARFCYYNDVKFNVFYSWLRNKRDNVEYFNKWANHWKKLDKFPPVSMDRIKKILVYYYPNLKVDKFYLEFKKMFNLETEQIQKIERIGPEQFETDKKFIVFNVGMGAGKTAQTIDYLKNKTSYLWISPNVALATNTAERIGPEIKLYTNYTTKEKHTGILEKFDRLVICQNSLHYINKKYKIVVIDEIETLLLKFQGEFIDKNGMKKTCWDNFIKIINEADKVILLDAFITMKTINFIKFFNVPIIYERKEEKTDRTVIYMKNMEAQILRILDDLNQGKKIFIFYPPKRGAGSILSMADLYEMLKSETGASGHFYNADIDEQIKKGLENVNKSWEAQNLIITNTCITCGVNYDLKDFHAVYLFITKYTLPRDIIQVSYRPRHLIENKIYACFLNGGVFPKIWTNDKESMESPIYNQLYDDCVKEFKSPLKNTFHHFCVKAGYKQHHDDAEELSDELEKSYKKMAEKYNIGINYENIETIRARDVEEIEARIFDKTATFADKMKLKKYFFMANFRRGVDVDFLAKLWNKQKLGIFQKIEKLIDPTHPFHLLKDLNGWDDVLPSPEFNFERVQINDEIKRRIFEKMSFKYLSEKSKPIYLIKTAINDFWGVEIIKSEQDDQRNVFYSYGRNLERIKEIYKFSLKYYKNLGEMLEI